MTFDVNPNSSLKYLITHTTEILYKNENTVPIHSGFSLKVQKGQTAYLHGKNGDEVDSCTVNEEGVCSTPFTVPLVSEPYYANFLRSTSVNAHESIPVDVYVSDKTKLPTEHQVITIGNDIDCEFASLSKQSTSSLGACPQSLYYYTSDGSTAIYNPLEATINPQYPVNVIYNP